MGVLDKLAPKLNCAQQILAHVGVYAAQLRRDTGYRLATPPRRMRKGEDGMRKAGGYGRGLTNWRTGKPNRGRV